MKTRSTILSVISVMALILAPVAGARGNQAGRRPQHSNYNAGRSEVVRHNHHQSYHNNYPSHHHHPTPPPPPCYHRPAPVHHHHCGPSFGQILGMAVGSALNNSLAYWSQNYQVASYNSNTVWLNNVYQANYMWPQAVITFNNNGIMSRATYIDRSNYYDPVRYNALLGNLTAQYGAPAYINNMTATWYGLNGQYLTLSYTTTPGAMGMNQYTTTLVQGL